MATKLDRLDARRPPADVVAALERDGAVIVDGLLGHDVVERFNAELDPLLAGTAPRREFLNPALAWFFGEKTRHLTAVASRSRVFVEEVLCHPLYRAVCEAILGPHCARHQLNLAHVLDRGPGAERQFLHRDELVWVHVPRPHPELQIASVIALVDFTEANGATVVAPGSHRWPLERQTRESDLVAAEMTAGSAVLYLGSTVHAGGANTTRHVWRRGMHLSYVLGWLRTEENHYLATPPEIARTLPREALELLGYAAHDALTAGGGYLGAVDLRDPADLLERGELPIRL